jgi:hypothetical protein
VNDPKRTCVFCGKTPLTLEHIFPQWINACWPKGTTSERFARAGSGDLVPRGSFRQVASNTARLVCATCNNEWMKDIEDSTRPLLCEMITGHGIQLDGRQQLALATWLIKTAFVTGAQKSRANTSYFQQGYERFGQRRQPGDDYLVTISTQGEDFLRCEDSFRPIVRIGDTEQDRSFSFFYVVCLGHFVGAVIYVEPPERFFPGRATIRSRQIWPIVQPSIAWPAGPYLTVKSLENFSKGPPIPNLPSEPSKVTR